LARAKIDTAKDRRHPAASDKAVDAIVIELVARMDRSHDSERR